MNIQQTGFVGSKKFVFACSHFPWMKKFKFKLKCLKLSKISNWNRIGV